MKNFKTTVYVLFFAYFSGQLMSIDVFRVSAESGKNGQAGKKSALTGAEKVYQQQALTGPAWLASRAGEAMGMQNRGILIPKSKASKQANHSQQELRQEIDFGDSVSSQQQSPQELDLAESVVAKSSVLTPEQKAKQNKLNSVAWSMSRAGEMMGLESRGWLLEKNKQPNDRLLEKAKESIHQEVRNILVEPAENDNELVSVTSEGPDSYSPEGFNDYYGISFGPAFYKFYESVPASFKSMVGFTDALNYFFNVFAVRASHLSNAEGERWPEYFSDVATRFLQIFVRKFNDAGELIEPVYEDEVLNGEYEVDSFVSLDSQEGSAALQARRSGLPFPPGENGSINGVEMVGRAHSIGKVF